MKKIIIFIMGLTISSLTANNNSNKTEFYNKIVPVINKVITKHQRTIKKIKSHTLNKYEHKKLLKLYRAKNDKELINKLIVHPKSIIIAQAAIESAWGKSRFFKQGNNIFGVWSFNKNEPRIRTLKKRSDGKYRYTKKYSSLEQSVEDYLVMIGRVSVYNTFRIKRIYTKNPYQLTKYLNKYCELGYKYTNKINKFIRSNNLTRFD